MAYGGGTFTSQNKTLPGAYINFVSTSSSTVNLFGSRGTVAVALPIATPDNKVLEWSVDDFKTKCNEFFGIPWNSTDTTATNYSAVQMLREIFCNASTVIVAGGLNGLSGKYSTGSNDYVSVTSNVAGDYNDYKISLYGSKYASGAYNFGIVLYSPSGVEIVQKAGNEDTLDESIEKAVERINSAQNIFTFTAKKGAPDFDEYLGSHAFTTSGGESISLTTSNAFDQHKQALAALSKKPFNILICNTYDGETDLNACSTTDYLKDLYHEFTRKQREELGVKFQTVYYDFLNTQGGSGEAVNSEYAISVKNDKDAIFWVGGALAGASFNESLCNKTYDGELTFDADISAEELKEAIEEGSFIFHTVGDEVRVMDDINTYVEDTTETKNKAVDIFNDNQSIRIIDQIGNDVATIFIDNFLGKVSATPEGRAAFWSSIVDYHEQMQNLGGITNFTSGNIQVLEGEARNSVIVNEVITLASSMKKLYMQVTVQ